MDIEAATNKCMVAYFSRPRLPWYPCLETAQQPHCQSCSWGALAAYYLAKPQRVRCGVLGFRSIKDIVQAVALHVKDEILHRVALDACEIDRVAERDLCSLRDVVVFTFLKLGLS